MVGGADFWRGDDGCLKGSEGGEGRERGGERRGGGRLSARRGAAASQGGAGCALGGLGPGPAEQKGAGRLMHFGRAQSNATMEVDGEKLGHTLAAARVPAKAKLPDSVAPCASDWRPWARGAQTASVGNGVGSASYAEREGEASARAYD